MSTTTEAAKAPKCPDCEGPMKLRNSVRGNFWGCLDFPSCRGTRKGSEETKDIPKSKPEYEPIPKLPGTDEQEAIWSHFQTNQKEHAIVEAVAGSGKTWASVQLCLRLPKNLKIGFFAFNKHIAKEAGGKLLASGCAHVNCSTSHSLGLKICKSAWKDAKIDDAEEKVWEILYKFPVPTEYAGRQWEWDETLRLTHKLVGFAKNYMLGPNTPDLAERLEQICEHHGIDMNGSAKAALAMVAPTLQQDITGAKDLIDFDDMIWLPVVCKLSVPWWLQFDVLICDEYQDFNLAQQELAVMCCPRGRIVVVGDRHQALYGFRGADTEAIPTAIKRLEGTARGVKIFPLTLTHRCPKLHVKMVQSLVPQIRAMENAPDGEVYNLSQKDAINNMKPGDLVLCRINAALIPAAYGLIKRGIKPIIRGRDIGKGMLSLVEKLEKKGAFTLPELTTKLVEYRRAEADKLRALGSKGAGRLSALMDKCECMVEMIRGAGTIGELKARINSIFADFDEGGEPKNAVVLGTVHRTKGLESHRVFVLAPNLLPHPMALQDWEKVQERNCCYVAATRAKFDKDNPGTLIFCGGIPEIYGAAETV